LGPSHGPLGHVRRGRDGGVCPGTRDRRGGRGRKPGAGAARRRSGRRNAIHRVRGAGGDPGDTGVATGIVSWEEQPGGAPRHPDTDPVPASILLIDDDISLLRSFGTFFEQQGWSVHREMTGEAGVSTHDRTLPDVVIVDLHLPGIDGLEVLERLRGTEAAVILLTGNGHIPDAVQAMRNGAENFLIKPIDLAHLHAVAENAAEKVRLRRINRTLIGRGARGGDLEALGSSPMMRELRERIETLARSDHPAVLIQGETGTGKREVARMFHDLSLRAEAPFVECVAASEERYALEATLFGLEGPTDGNDGGTRVGLLEIADGGTLLLEEITAAPEGAQVRLGAMLEHRAYRRSGGTREFPVDVRLVATT